MKTQLFAAVALLAAALGCRAPGSSESGVLGYSYLVNRGRKREAMRFWERVSAASEALEREAS